MAREYLRVGSAGEQRSHARKRQARRQYQRLRRREVVGTQLTPAGGMSITLPRIRIPLFRLAAGLALGVMLVAGVLLLLRILKPAEAQVMPNALWLGTEWTYEEHDGRAMRALAERLRENEIGTVYAWVSWLQGGPRPGAARSISRG